MTRRAIRSAALEILDPERQGDPPRARRGRPSPPASWRRPRSRRGGPARPGGMTRRENSAISRSGGRAPRPGRGRRPPRGRRGTSPSERNAMLGGGADVVFNPRSGDEGSQAEPRLGVPMQTVTVEFRTDDLVRSVSSPPGSSSATRRSSSSRRSASRAAGGSSSCAFAAGPLRSAAELERESRRIRRLYGLEEFELVERRPQDDDYILLVRQRNPADPPGAHRPRRWRGHPGRAVPGLRSDRDRDRSGRRNRPCGEILGPAPEGGAPVPRPSDHEPSVPRGPASAELTGRQRATSSPGPGRSATTRSRGGSRSLGSPR